MNECVLTAFVVFFFFFFEQFIFMFFNKTPNTKCVANLILTFFKKTKQNKKRRNKLRRAIYWRLKARARKQRQLYQQQKHLRSQSEMSFEDDWDDFDSFFDDFF